jgi:glycosyltransferase involved in cell wall biosynthesis
MRYAVISSHPIQYNAPLFKYLNHADKYKFQIFYTWGVNSLKVFDPGFRKYRTWDIELLGGYDYTFVENVSKNSGSHHFYGIVNPTLINLVETYNPDAILIYGWKFHSHLRLMRHFKGKIPIILRGDSTLLDEPKIFSLKKWCRQQILKWVYKNVDHALSPGFASDEYFRWVGLNHDQIHRAVHAVDNKRFVGEMGDGRWELGNGDQELGVRNQELGIRNEELDQRALLWKKELGITNDKKVFLFAGKFEPKKDPLLLIHAFKQLFQKRSDIHLIMVGNGILEEQIKMEISISQFPSTTLTPSTSSTSLNLSQHSSTPSTSLNLSQPPSTFPITLLPFQNQSIMPIVYRLGDVFVLPSKGPGETWGLSVNEAMASGRAVIVSDKCGCANDLFPNHFSKYIFPAGDVDALTIRMEIMLDNNAFIAIGKENQERIRVFSYDSFLNVLRKILA